MTDVAADRHLAPTIATAGDAQSCRIAGAKGERAGRSFLLNTVGDATLSTAATGAARRTAAEEVARVNCTSAIPVGRSSRDEHQRRPRRSKSVYADWRTADAMLHAKVGLAGPTERASSRTRAGAVRVFAAELAANHADQKGSTRRSVRSVS